jgi:hypothetical protein
MEKEHKMTIRKGDQVQIKPEFQDAGDDRFTWVAVTDADKGRVQISPIDTGLAFAPVYVMNLDWLVDA